MTPLSMACVKVTHAVSFRDVTDYISGHVTVVKIYK